MDSNYKTVKGVHILRILLDMMEKGGTYKKLAFIGHVLKIIEKY